MLRSFGSLSCLRIEWQIPHLRVRRSLSLERPHRSCSLVHYLMRARVFFVLSFDTLCEWGIKRECEKKRALALNSEAKREIFAGALDVDESFQNIDLQIPQIVRTKIFEARPREIHQIVAVID